MFWKRKQKEVASTEVSPPQNKLETSKQKAKELDPLEIVTNEIEQLLPGQSLVYQLPEFLGRKKYYGVF